MADLMTIKETFGSFKGLKFSYVGDGNNVTNSLLKGAALVGADISVGCPNDYQPNQNQINIAKSIAEKTGSKIEIIDSPYEAVKNAHVIYGDVWTSMGQEAEYEQRKEIFKGYQINDALCANAAKNHIVLHCLPAPAYCCLHPDNRYLNLFFPVHFQLLIHKFHHLLIL